AVSADGLLGFGEGSIGHDRLPAIQLHGGGGVHRLQLVALDDLALSVELAPPLTDPAEDFLLLCLGNALPGACLTDQQHHVFHACPPCGLPACLFCLFDEWGDGEIDSALTIARLVGGGWIRSIRRPGGRPGTVLDRAHSIRRTARPQPAAPLAL